MNTKTKIGIGIIIIIILLGISVIFIAQPQEQGIFTIGAIVPLTGPAADTGEQIRNGLLLAVEEINQKDGIAGKQISLFLEDSQSKPQIGVTAFQSLAELKNPCSGHFS